MTSEFGYTEEIPMIRVSTYQAATFQQRVLKDLCPAGTSRAYKPSLLARVVQDENCSAPSPQDKVLEYDD